MLPSAAMAGSIGNSVGSEAIRVTGASNVNSTVKVVSGITRNNDMYVYGTSKGRDLSISAEDYLNGGRGYEFTNYDVTAQNAADIDSDIKADAHFKVKNESDDTHTYDKTKKTFKAQAYEPGGKECHWWHCTHTDETPAKPRKVVRTGTTGDTHTGKIEGNGGGSLKGTYSGIATVDSQGEFQDGSGGGAYINGSFNESNDSYTGGYKGWVREDGLTTTNVTSNSFQVGTENGFESGSFNSTEWN